MKTQIVAQKVTDPPMTGEPLTEVEKIKTRDPRIAALIIALVQDVPARLTVGFVRACIRDFIAHDKGV